MGIFEPQFQYFHPFLEEKHYNDLETYVLSHDFKWSWLSHTVSKDHDNHSDDAFVLGNLIYHDKMKDAFDTIHEVWRPLIEAVEKQFICNIYRMRCNLYTNQNKKIFTIPHHDIGERGVHVPDRKFDIIILNFTTCNGGTKIGSLEVMSQRNGAVFFNNVHKHCGILHTDVQRRVCCNIVISPKE